MKKLPVRYSRLTPDQRREVRERYIKLQKGKCFYCKHPLSGDPPKKITDKEIDWSLFPSSFLKYPVHLVEGMRYMGNMFLKNGIFVLFAGIRSHEHQA